MNPLLAAGVELMLVGMSTVFFFLAVLVLATSAMSRLVMRFAPAPPDGVDPALVAVITAAITQHRKSTRR